jgi:uncharacterized SAM-binding protein YcdF (DUF218 family)
MRVAPLVAVLFSRLRSLAACLGLLFAVITATPLLDYWTAALSTPLNENDGGVLIVLGGDIVSPEMIGLSSYWRSCYAVLEWRTGSYDRILVSGRAIAPLMRDFIVGQGVPSQFVQVENTSLSTRQNALYVAAILRGDPGRKVLLTSDYHMGRAQAVFRKAGIETTPLPIPDAHKRLANWAERWSIFVILLQETVKVAYYKSLGWT